MKTSDMLATDCAREFAEWLTRQMEGEPVVEPLRLLLRDAFVAGYERGGRQGAEQMYRETLSVLRSEPEASGGRKS